MPLTPHGLKHLWEKFYPVVSLVLGSIVAGYYLWRVAHGGHAIPVADIERRFPRSLRHLLDDFSHRVDHCACFMNNGEHPVLVFDQRGDHREIAHGDYYQLLTEEAGK